MAQMVNEESRVCLYQDYMATGVKILAEMYSKCHGGDLKLPSFIEMTHEAVKQESAGEILEHVRKLFSGGGEEINGCHDSGGKADAEHG